MALDGFYLSYAFGLVPLPLVFTFCSSCNETLLSRVSLMCVVLQWCVHLQGGGGGGTGVYVMQMCPGIPACMTSCRRCESQRHQ